MSRIILLNKPYGVVCQFTPAGDHPTLKSLVDVPDVYPAGRLDADSEGLVVLTDDGAVQHAITSPRSKMEKTYLVQVEGVATDDQLIQLSAGVTLRDYKTLPCAAQHSTAPEWLWQRVPPIRERKAIPVSWIEITLTEGRNRQVRHMTAAVGLPTLRLVRIKTGPWSVADIALGQWCETERPSGIRSTRPSPTDTRRRQPVTNRRVNSVREKSLKHRPRKERS